MAAEEELAEQSLDRFIGISVRVAEILLGLVFIVGAGLKAYDVDAFAVQISAYGVVKDPGLVRAVAYGSITIETILGIALLSGWSFRGSVHAVTFALLTVFTGLIAYAWAFKGLEDCGCFGAFIQMTPAVSILKNAVMMALTLGAAIGRGYVNRSTTLLPMVMSAVPGIATTVLAVLFVGGTFVYHAAQPDAQDGGEEAVRVTTRSPDQADRPFARFTFDAGGQTIDLGDGEHLVAMLSATCDHCMAWVEPLNELTLLPELPPLAALMMGSEAEIQEFRQLTAPMFPTKRVADPLVFMNLIDPAPPRLYRVRDGRSLNHWDEEVPSIEELLAETSGA